MINTAPETNDHNCLMPNHPFHTHFYERALFSFTAFLLSRQVVVRGTCPRYQTQGHTSCGIPLGTVNNLLHIELFLSLHLKEADPENTNSRIFLFSHSQTMDAVCCCLGNYISLILISRNLTLFSPHCKNIFNSHTLFSVPP